MTPCQPITIENCYEIYDATTCLKCDKNYYLNNLHTCSPFPFPKVDDCLVYSSFQNCIKCVDGFRLASETECVTVTPIDNCVLYDQSSSANKCKACLPEFYVSGNLCVARQNSVSIPNCETLNPLSDTCLNCSATFVLSNDQLFCASEKPNCI